MAGGQAEQRGGLAVSVTPVQRVVELLGDLRTQLEDELIEEGDVFHEFFDFAESQDESLKEQIDDSNSGISDNDAGLNKTKAKIAALEESIAKLTKKQQTKEQELVDTTNAYNEEKKRLDAELADLRDALRGLGAAIRSLQEGKTAFLSTSAKAVIEQNLALAEALGIAATKARSALLQLQGPGDYQYHSQDIIEILKMLTDEFEENESSTANELSERTNAFEMTEESLKKEIKDTIEALKKASEELDNQNISKGSHEYNLVELNKNLDFDSAFLKDLRAQYGAKKKQWAQREQMRKDEIAAITQAMKSLETTREKDESANARTFLVQESADGSSVKMRGVRMHRRVEESDVGISFLQETLATHENTARFLTEEARRLRSPSLLSMAEQVKGPFEKVKRLIQNLIERLLAEAAAEATNQGQCETEVAKATMERDARAEDVNNVNAKLAALESTKLELESALETLESEIAELKSNLDTETKNREKDHEINTTTLEDARTGLAALDDAIKVLKTFYKGTYGVGGADTATVFAQATPLQEVDEYAEVAKTKGAYQGAQDRASGIFGLLEVIRTDFVRTIKVTERDEKENQAAYVVYRRENKVETKMKETQEANKTKDLELTDSDIATSHTELDDNLELMGTALKRLQELWPMCVLVDMPWEERKAKIEGEIEALKTACKQLSPDGSGCPELA